MRLAIFAKKRTTEQGKTFYSYLTRLKKKSGEEITAQVKFREDCGQPKGEDCPVYIKVEKADCNFNEQEIVSTETGEVINSRVLWVSKWVNDGKYVDTSMDDFE